MMIVEKKQTKMRLIYKVWLMFSCALATHQVLLPAELHADWQETLESHFDIVDTFDHLRDWSGTSIGDIYGTVSAPKKKDGSDSIWQQYHTSFLKAANAEDWISDHGEYSWNRNGSVTPKSFCLQHDILYQQADDEQMGHGAQRLGTFFGDGVTGKSGYKKIHIFFLVRFKPGYFSKYPPGDPNEGAYEYMGYLKFFEAMLGFTEIGKFGTDAERATVRNTPQTLQVYGCNDTVFNWGGGGLSNSYRLFFLESTFTAKYHTGDNPGWGYERSPDIVTPRRMSDNGETDIQDMYEAGEWIAVEVALDRGDVDQSNGTIDLWLYNGDGAEIAHWSRTGEQRVAHFDHYYNKVVLGGNRTQDIIPSDTRAYIDDFIVHGSRIGENYFSLLKGQPIRPLAPQGLKTAD